MGAKFTQINLQFICGPPLINSTKGLSVVDIIRLFLFSRTARRMQSSAAEADMDEFRAGIHNDRGFGYNVRSERGQAA